jgi:hypothetical protein
MSSARLPPAFASVLTSEAGLPTSLPGHLADLGLRIPRSPVDRGAAAGRTGIDPQPLRPAVALVRQMPRPKHTGGDTYRSPEPHAKAFTPSRTRSDVRRRRSPARPTAWASGRADGLAISGALGFLVRSRSGIHHAHGYTPPVARGVDSRAARPGSWRDDGRMALPAQLRILPLRVFWGGGYGDLDGYLGGGVCLEISHCPGSCGCVDRGSIWHRSNDGGSVAANRLRSRSGKLAVRRHEPGPYFLASLLIQSIRVST